MSDPLPFHGVTPVFRVTSVAASVPYYVDKLGFGLNFKFGSDFAAGAAAPVSYSSSKATRATVAPGCRSASG